MTVFGGVKTIISGGQTGADRAAFDFAIAKGFEIAGFVPRGRMAEDGPIPARYANLVETASEDPAERTRLNVENSDATLVISRGPLAGGSDLTLEFARSAGRPVLHIDLAESEIAAAAREARAWLDVHRCGLLNIAGPRASEDASIYRSTMEFLTELFK